MKLLVAIAIAVSFAGPGLAQTSNTGGLSAVVAQLAPSPADLMARYYPDRALRMRVEGIGRVRCKVVANGFLDDCGVVSETPPDFGFGDAALKILKTYQVDAAKYAPGSNVTLPVRFNIPPATLPTLTTTIGLFYPVRALKDQREGQVGVRCIVAPDGTLRDCGVASERPADYGFGAAALKMISSVRMDVRNPKFAPGSTITLPIRFNLPPKTNSAAPTPTH